MAENNQNTEVEDILSSIKNILEEDEQKHGSLSASSGKTDDVVDDVINSAPGVNDILELSPDMRIDETPSAEAPLQGKADADPVASVILEPEDNHTIAEHIETVDTAPSLEPSDTAPEDKSASDNLIANEFSGIDIGVEDMGDEDSSTVLASQPKADNNVSVAEEVVVAPLEEIQVSNEESNTAPEPIAATETPLETKEKELPPVKEEQSSSAIADATVDASANIISNFAKMFSRPSPVEPVAAPAAEKVEIVAPGDVSKTLEEFVLDSITKVIGREISAKWNDGAEFEKFAREEIVRQTQAWINDNLPQMVEHVVKQEIERVIAKVGS